MFSANGKLHYEITSSMQLVRSDALLLASFAVDDHYNKARFTALNIFKCWTTTRGKECRFAVMETKVLRWISRITLNIGIRGRYVDVSITEKVPKECLRWSSRGVVAHHFVCFTEGRTFQSQLVYGEIFFMGIHWAHSGFLWHWIPFHGPWR